MSDSTVEDSELKPYRIKLFPREQIEPEEIFFDSSKTKEFEAGETETGKLEMPISQTIFRIFGILQVSLILSIALFTGLIVFIKGETYALQGEKNSSRVTPLFAPRGIVYSKDGEALAENILFFDVLLNTPSLPHDRNELADLSSGIGETLGIDEESIYQKLIDAKGKRFAEFTLLKNVSGEKAEQLKAILADKPFIELRENSRRRYSNDLSLSHILGYTGEASPSDLATRSYLAGERTGKSGVEAFYEEVLHGEAGHLTKRMNSKGEILNRTISKNPLPGKNVTLTINAELQKKTHKILIAHAKKLGIEAAIAILLDPSNGKIIALVSIPAFDANPFEEGIDEKTLLTLIENPAKPLFNRAIAGEYPSGSIIKPIIAAAALEERLVTPTWLIYSSGSIFVPSVYNSEVLYEFKDWKAHGWTDMHKAIADSVNIYFYVIGGGYKGEKGLGMKKIEEYLLKFGWGKTLGIDLPGERAGFIPSPKWKKEIKGENWYIGDTYLASIGQGDILVTPMQVAFATSVFANRGTLFQPQIVGRIGETELPSEVLNKDFVTKEYVDIVRKGMRRAVTSGSSRFLADFPHSVAGKTGTAQTGRGKNHAWFTGFAPYEEPEVVITVLMEEGESSNYAVHAARDILNAYFSLSTQ